MIYQNHSCARLCNIQKQYHNIEERENMSYEEFILKVEECLKERMISTGQVSIKTSFKNNGQIRKGIAFAEEGADISPIIYLEEYFECFNQGSPFDMIINQICALYKNIKKEHCWEGEYILKYNNVKNKIIYKLISRQRNKELLKKIPYVPYLDLAIVFCVLVEIQEKEGNIATMLIRNEHLRYWDVSAGEIFKAAAENTEKLLPSDLRTLYTMIKEITGNESEDETGENDMYVLTNTIRNFGAATILYEDRLKIIRMCFGENYYILPSSIHEVILLPESKAVGKNELSEIVKEINETQVKAEEVLSDSAYYFDGEKIMM